MNSQLWGYASKVDKQKGFLVEGGDRFGEKRLCPDSLLMIWRLYRKAC